MPLPNAVIVYPGHGAGSACGKNMSKETTDGASENVQLCAQGRYEQGRIYQSSDG